MKRSFGFVFFLVPLVVVLAAAGCSGSNDTLRTGGRVQFVLSPDSSGTTTSSVLTVESPGALEGNTLSDNLTPPPLQSANVTFSSILAKNVDGELVDVSADLPVTVDLLQVVEGGSVTLPAGSLPDGTYVELVVVMTGAELVLADGTSVEITPPPGGWTVIVRVCPFTVAEGETTTVRLLFRHRGAFRMLAGGMFEFHPDFACEAM